MDRHDYTDEFWWAALTSPGVIDHAPSVQQARWLCTCSLYDFVLVHAYYTVDVTR